MGITDNFFKFYIERNLLKNFDLLLFKEDSELLWWLFELHFVRFLVIKPQVFLGTKIFFCTHWTMSKGRFNLFVNIWEHAVFSRTNIWPYRRRVNIMPKYITFVSWNVFAVLDLKILIFWKISNSNGWRSYENRLFFCHL